MKRTGFARLGIGAWMSGVGLLAVAAAPVMAGDFSIGGLFAGGAHGGTVIGGFLRIGEPAHVVAPPVVVTRPVVVAPPVVVERVWVSTPRVECRQVPVFDRFGNVIAYREECVTIPDGHWETVTRPAPAACVAQVVVSRNDHDRGPEGRFEHRDEPRAGGSQRYFAPPPGRVPTASDKYRNTLPAPVGWQARNGSLGQLRTLAR